MIHETIIVLSVQQAFDGLKIRQSPVYRKSFLPFAIVPYLRAHAMTTFSKVHISILAASRRTIITITTRKGCTASYYPLGF